MEEGSCFNNHTGLTVVANVCAFLLTLLDIIMVSRDLLCELKATLRVDAWIMMRMEWKTEEQPLRKITKEYFSTEYHTIINQSDATYLIRQIRYVAFE